jgi:hypothetical protein
MKERNKEKLHFNVRSGGHILRLGPAADLIFDVLSSYSFSVSILQTRYVELYSQNSCERPRGTPSPILNANMAQVAQTLQADLAVAASDEEAAIIFRAFLIQSCSGTFNPLFSGDGFTVTGFGGLLSPTSSEFIVSPFFHDDVPQSSKATIPFCINGQNGGKPNPDGSCAILVAN